MAEQEGRFEGVEEVAERLLVDPQTVRRWIKSGKLKAYKPGREYRILSSDLDAFLEARSSPKDQSRPSPEASEEEAAEEEQYVRPIALVELKRAVAQLESHNQELRNQIVENDEYDLKGGEAPPAKRAWWEEARDLERSLYEEYEKRGILRFTEAVRTNNPPVMTSLATQRLCQQFYRELVAMETLVAEVRLMSFYAEGYRYEQPIFLRRQLDSGVDEWAQKESRSRRAEVND